MRESRCAAGQTRSEDLEAASRRAADGAGEWLGTRLLKTLRRNSGPSYDPSVNMLRTPLAKTFIREATTFKTPPEAGAGVEKRVGSQVAHFFIHEGQIDRSHHGVLPNVQDQPRVCLARAVRKHGS